MKTYGVLVIGCGHIGMEHLLDIYYHEDIRIEAVAAAVPWPGARTICLFWKMTG